MIVTIGVAAVCAVAFAAPRAARAQTPVPSCLLAPPPLGVGPTSSPSPLPTEAATPVCAVVAKVLAATPARDVAWIPGSGLNAILGLDEGGFPAETYALQFRVSKAFNAAMTGPDELVRVGADDGRARGGSWWTPLEFVSDAQLNLLTTERISAVLALPAASMPRVAAYSVGVAEGTLGYVGIAAPAFGEPGGAVQFWFPAEPVFTSRTAPLGTR